uniref:Uncharacterized protein n=1 Tax=Spongospora subterranea TaxID=70186 RepID=A0A0H5R3P4_9EUKA|eukprot:CRZ08800.1 hypothetical protein [Spongospora subterranea]
MKADNEAAISAKSTPRRRRSKPDRRNHSVDMGREGLGSLMDGELWNQMHRSSVPTVPELGQMRSKSVHRRNRSQSVVSETVDVLGHFAGWEPPFKEPSIEILLASQRQYRPELIQQSSKKASL